MTFSLEPVPKGSLRCYPELQSSFCPKWNFIQKPPPLHFFNTPFKLILAERESDISSGNKEAKISFYHLF